MGPEPPVQFLARVKRQDFECESTIAVVDLADRPTGCEVAVVVREPLGGGFLASSQEAGRRARIGSGRIAVGGHVASDEAGLAVLRDCAIGVVLPSVDHVCT